MKQDYFFFIDESGDHGLNPIDPGFPIFILCGTVMSEKDYLGVDFSFDQIKEKIWDDKNVIFHSRDIRRWQKEFALLVNPDIRQEFFQLLNTSISKGSYLIISAAIHKLEYIKKYGVLNDVYSISLSFILERVIFYLDTRNDVKGLYIIIEKRGKREDAILLSYFNQVCDSGTFYVESKRFKSVIRGLDFVDKKDNENGLQLSDLVAYPIATHVLDPQRPNPAFDIVKQKLYSRRGGNYDGYGLKIFP